MPKRFIGIYKIALARLSGVVFLAALTLSLSTAAFGEKRTFSYTDPVGDSAGTIDVTQMVVVFDNTTGSYKITLTSTTAQPFLGAFRVNVNLFNANRLPDYSFFQDAVNDYDLANAKTKLILTGVDASLPFWAAGDTVTTNTVASGGVNPPGSTFYRTAVNNFPIEAFTNEDTVAYDLPGTAVIAVLTPQGVVSGLTDDVQAVLEDGLLSRSQANSLDRILRHALRSLNRGNLASGCDQIQEFINEANDLRHAAALAGSVDDAQELQDQIGCNAVWPNLSVPFFSTRTALRTRVSATIFNAGPGDVRHEFLVLFEALGPGTSCDSQFVRVRRPLDAGRSMFVRTETGLRLCGGPIRTRVTVDPGNSVVETDEGNNCLETAAVCTTTPNP